MKMTGMPSPRATSSSNRSSPLVPGIRTSRIRHPGPFGAKSRRKPAAEGKRLGAEPDRLDEPAQRVPHVRVVIHDVDCWFRHRRHGQPEA